MVSFVVVFCILVLMMKEKTGNCSFSLPLLSVGCSYIMLNQFCLHCPNQSTGQALEEWLPKQADTTASFTLPPDQLNSLCAMCILFYMLVSGGGYREAHRKLPYPFSDRNSNDTNVHGWKSSVPWPLYNDAVSIGSRCVPIVFVVVESRRSKSSFTQTRCCLKQLLVKTYSSYNCSRPRFLAKVLVQEQGSLPIFKDYRRWPADQSGSLLNE